MAVSIYYQRNAVQIILFMELCGHSVCAHVSQRAQLTHPLTAIINGLFIVFAGFLGLAGFLILVIQT